MKIFTRSPESRFEACMIHLQFSWTPFLDLQGIKRSCNAVDYYLKHEAVEFLIAEHFSFLVDVCRSSYLIYSPLGVVTIGAVQPCFNYLVADFIALQLCRRKQGCLPGCLGCLVCFLGHRISPK